MWRGRTTKAGRWSPASFFCSTATTSSSSSACLLRSINTNAKSRTAVLSSSAGTTCSSANGARRLSSAACRPITPSSRGVPAFLHVRTVDALVGGFSGRMASYTTTAAAGSEQKTKTRKTRAKSTTKAAAEALEIEEDTMTMTREEQDDRGTSTTTVKTSASVKKRMNPVISRYPLRPVVPDERKFVKLVSWNVVSLNSITSKGSLQHYVREEQPHVLCLQETKVTRENIPLFKGKTFHEQDVYNYEYHNCSVARKGYSGVAMYSKYKPIRIHYGIGIEEHDHEGRCITLEFAKFFLVGTYIPNSGDELRRLDYRQKWNKDFEDYLYGLSQRGLTSGIDIDADGKELPPRALGEEERKGKPVIWCGDLNVAHQEIDLHAPEHNHYTAGFTDEERDDFGRVMKAMDFIDSYRWENPTRQTYSFWSYRAAARARNAGWRLDYFLYQRSLAPFVRRAFIRNYVLGSDHCPVGLLVDPVLFAH